MALQFRKRLKLAKGMYLNLSQSGVSMPVGTKGARLTTERVNWRKWLGTAALAGAAALAPMKAHGAGSEAQWEQALNRSWQGLSPKQRTELIQSERNWIKWKDSLSDDERYNAIRNRVAYLDAYKEEGPASAEERQLDLTGPADPTIIKIPVDDEPDEPAATPTPTPAPTEQPATALHWTKDGKPYNPSDQEKIGYWTSLAQHTKLTNPQLPSPFGAQEDWKLWSQSPGFQQIFQGEYKGDMKKFETALAWEAKLGPNPLADKPFYSGDSNVYQPDFDEGARRGDQMIRYFLGAGKTSARKMFTGAPFDDFEDNVKIQAMDTMQKGYKPEDIKSPRSFEGGFITAVAQALQ